MAILAEEFFELHGRTDDGKVVDAPLPERAR
jgi:hypothetical protein